MVTDRDWLFERALARVDGTVEELLADYATSYVGRPVQRRVVPPPRPGVAWSIDGEIVVEFVHHEAGADQVLVHDIALLEDLRKRLRTRHIDVAHVASTWQP